jgi:hypothetical protein
MYVKTALEISFSGLKAYSLLILKTTDLTDNIFTCFKTQIELFSDVKRQIIKNASC